MLSCRLGLRGLMVFKFTDKEFHGAPAPYGILCEPSGLLSNWLLCHQTCLAITFNAKPYFAAFGIPARRKRVLQRKSLL